MADEDLRTAYPKLPSIIPLAGKRIAAAAFHSCRAKSGSTTSLAAVNLEKISLVVDPAPIVQDIKGGLIQRRIATFEIATGRCKQGTGK